MDWTTIFDWLEQKTGVSYDLNDDLSEIGGYVAFDQPFFWQVKISFIVEDMENAIAAVDEYKNELTEDLPPRAKLKKGIESEYIRRLAENINFVKKSLGMAITPIKSEEDVLTNVSALHELISTMKSFPIDSLQTREWFNKYDESTDNVLTEVLELHENDIIDIHQAVETIIESFNDDEDDEDADEDEVDADLEEDV